MKKGTRYLLPGLLVSLFISCSTITEVNRESVIPGEGKQGEEIKKTFPSDLTRKDRAMGAIVGAVIGDALGVGCHWFYDLECFESEFGWVDDYVDPRPDSRCHNMADITKLRIKAGLKKGGPSQTGQFMIMLIESVAENAEYDQDDYTARIDEFFETINGTPYSGRYTDWAIRDTYRNRVKKEMSWDDPNIGSLAPTSEGAQRAVILAARYDNPVQATQEMYRCIRLTYRDDFVVGQQTAFGIVVNALIEGVQLTDMFKHLDALHGNREISTTMVQAYDSINQVGIGQSAWNPHFRNFPPHLISLMFGQDCEQDHLLPAAYWLAHRYPDDFEAAVLAAINGGGNNMARAALTGALLGAMNGLSGIPERFIKGLENHEHILELAEIISRSYPADP